MPKVLNKRDLSNGLIPKGAVYVGRPTPWGNMYTHLPSLARANRNLRLVATRKEAVEMYASAGLPEILATRDVSLEDLRGKDLVCWCAPLPCHADVLLEAANA